MFTRQLPFCSAEATEVKALIGAGLEPYSVEQCSRLNKRVLSIAKPMIGFEPKNRPTAKDVLESISMLLT